jgi:hypothetical protein
MLLTRYPIYIPSRGRAETAATPRLFDASAPYWFVVDESEAAAYRHRYGAEHVLENHEPVNQGLIAARNFCKDHAASIGAKYHWQLDDDIKSIANYSAKKRGDLSPAECLSYAETFVGRYANIGAACLGFTTFGLMAKVPYELNKGMAGCVLYRSDVPYEFREDVPEDAEYTLQLLAGGWVTVKFYAFLITVPPLGSKPGGLQVSVYQNLAVQDARVDRMRQLWPADTREVRKPDGTRGVACRWANYRDLPLRSQL